MSVVLQYAPPRNAEDVAKLISVFMADTFGWSATGGADEDGGEFVYEQPAVEAVRVTVADAGDKPAALLAVMAAEPKGEPATDPGVIRGLARYFDGRRRLDEVEAAAMAGRDTDSAQALSDAVDYAVAVVGDARDELIALVRQWHGIAPGVDVPHSIALSIDGHVLAIPVDDGESPCGLNMIPRSAVAVVRA